MKTLQVSNKTPVRTLLKILIGAMIVGAAFLAMGYLANLTTGQSLIIGDLSAPRLRGQEAGKKIRIEVVKTPAAMEKGLGGRKSLAENAGMLFVYGGDYLPKFWMKDMKFPIDIIWLRDGMVTGFEKNVPLADSAPLPVYQPKDFIDAVLEVNAGFVDKNGIKIGDEVVTGN